MSVVSSPAMHGLDTYKRRGQSVCSPSGEKKGIHRLLAYLMLSPATSQSSSSQTCPQRSMDRRSPTLEGER